MDWRTILLGIIKGAFAIIADNYVHRAREARARARKHAPPQPKVDDWARPTKPPAATPIVIETEEGRHFSVSSFIDVEGYGPPPVRKERKPGESRRTRRKRPAEQPVGLEAVSETVPEAIPDVVEDVPEALPPAKREPVVTDARCVGAVLDKVPESTQNVYPVAGMDAPLEPNGMDTRDAAVVPSMKELVAELLGACRRVRLIKDRQILLQLYTRARVLIRSTPRSRTPTEHRKRTAGEDH